MASQGFRVLHVTDQHFCNSHFWAPKTDRVEAEYSEERARQVATSHFEELEQALDVREETRPPFDGIVLSGDFTDRHLARGFDIARNWVDLLIDRRLAPVENILLIPGNHDVHLGEKQSNSKTSFPIPRSVAEQDYRAFLEGLKQPLDNTNEHLSVATRIARRDSEVGLILIGLNSCRTERLDTRGWGYVGLDQLDTILSRILKGQAAFRAKDNDILVAFTHHNPLPLWDLNLSEITKPISDRTFSFLTDAPTLLRALNAFNFAILMHGHAHFPKTVRLEGYDPREDRFTRSLVISGQGSFSANLNECERHHFAVLEIGKDSGWRDRHLSISHFYAARLPVGSPRDWEVSPEGGQRWPLSDLGWRADDIIEMRKTFRGSTVAAADAWRIMNSWASLYVRPQKEEDRERSSVWQDTLQSLAAQVSEMLRTPIEVKAIAGVIDDMFANEQPSPGDLSGTYLHQFLAWKLRKA